MHDNKSIKQIIPRKSDPEIMSDKKDEIIEKK